jgi:hypothetical protein
MLQFLVCLAFSYCKDGSIDFHILYILEEKPESLIYCVFYECQCIIYIYIYIYILICMYKYGYRHIPHKFTRHTFCIAIGNFVWNFYGKLWCQFFEIGSWTPELKWHSHLSYFRHIPSIAPSFWSCLNEETLLGNFIHYLFCPHRNFRSQVFL